MSPPYRAFIDTNIVVYAFAAGSGPDAAKTDQARTLLLSKPVISVQVLNEFANVARKRLRWEWPHIQVVVEVVREAASEIRPIDLDTHLLALSLAHRHQLSFYGAVIAASAVRANCQTLYSEDMQDGLEINGHLRVANPFFSR